MWYLRDELAPLEQNRSVRGSVRCTVHIDAKAVPFLTVMSIGGSCVDHHRGASLLQSPVQKAWRAANVPQCAYCQCGQIMSAAGLLAENKNPSDEEILAAMSRNICRCGCYQRIFAAIKSAAQEA